MKFRSKTKYPIYFRSKRGTYCKVTGPKTYLKAGWDGGDMVLQEANVNRSSCAEIFNTANWTRINKGQWEANLEPLAAMDRGIRSRKTIEFVFEHEGKKYFQYASWEDYPIGRIQEMEAVMMEIEARMDAKALGKWFDTMETELSKDSISLVNLAGMVQEMQSRRKLTWDGSIWRKLGAVLFFTEDEDTSKVDWRSHRETLKAWESLPDDFFLSTPLRTFFPFGSESLEGSKASLTQAKVKLAVSNARLEHLYSRISTASPEDLPKMPKGGAPRSPKRD